MPNTRKTAAVMLGLIGGISTAGPSLPPKVVKFCHKKARCEVYPASKIKRFVVPDEKVSWSEQFKDYKPVEYTSEVVLKGPVWADPIISKTKQKIRFNALDGKVNRKSFTGTYEIINGVPRNPCGRTGISGRGLLGKWGPNHAADPIVTRWKRNANNKVVKHEVSEKPVLQFVAIQRRDTKEWALPGGMVDADETVSLTLKREFGEEALNLLEMSKEEKKNLEKQISKLFAGGDVVFKGYVDDPRNTDNAWMESVAVNFHDDSGKSAGLLPLEAGDDAGAVCWMDLDSNISLFASHSFFLEKVAAMRKAHW